MNKVGVLFLLLLSVFLIGIVSANLDDLSDTLDEKVESLEDTVDVVENLDETIETKWDYLGKEWQKVFLQNKVVSSIDRVFQKISIVFEIIFAHPYSLSLTLLCIVLLWFYFFLKFSEILVDYSAFSSGTSNLIAIGLTMLVAHLNILFKVIQFFGWLIFTQEASWMRWLIFLAIITFMIIFYKVSSIFGEVFKESREGLEKEKSKHHMGIIEKYAEALIRGSKNS